MQRREFVLAGASIVGATSIGAVAFTQADVERDVNVDIVTDDNGPITLNPGSTAAVELVDGLLTVDTNTANANGLNGDGSFTYGDDASPSSTHAFSMTNNSGGTRSFTLGFSDFSLGGTSSITLSVYDDTGTSIGDVSTTTDQTTTLDAGDTVYAVLSFDTTGLTDGANMNGTLTIDAVQ